MSKYAFVALIFVFLFASVVQAEDQPVTIPDRKAAMVRVMNSDFNAFDGANLSAILQMAYEWIGNQQEIDDWWCRGDINVGDVGSGALVSQGKIDDLNAEITELQTMIAGLDRNAELDGILTTLQNELNTTQDPDRINELNAQIAQAQTEKGNLETRIKDWTDARTDLTIEKTALQAKVQNVQTEINSLTVNTGNRLDTKRRELASILYDWMNMVDTHHDALQDRYDAGTASPSDQAELAAMTGLGLNDFQYTTARHGSTEAEKFYEKNTSTSYLDQLAYHDELAQNRTYSLGTYMGRNTTSSEHNGTYQQLQIVTGGEVYNLYVSATQTPLVLDIDGDGKLEASNGEWLPHPLNVALEKLVSFDMNCDGFDEKVEWVGVNDGLLLVYKDGETVTGKHLFGTEGGKYQNGYEKLALLDVDKDGKLSGDELKTLSVWQDKNGNAVVDAEEVVSVGALEISEFGVTHKGGLSYFIHKGERKVMWDWYPATFDVKKTEENK